MNVNLDFDLLLQGVMLAGLGVLAHRLAPECVQTSGNDPDVAIGVRHWPISQLLASAQPRRVILTGRA